MRSSRTCAAMTALAVRSVFKPRIGRSLAFSRPWSHSIRLFACLIVLCNACGNNSSITFANAAARSVTTSSGSPCERLLGNQPATGLIESFVTEFDQTRSSLIAPHSVNTK